MTPAYYRDRAQRCLAAHPELLPAGFQAVVQRTHDFGLLETVRGELPAGLRQALRDALAQGRGERVLVVLGTRVIAPADAVAAGDTLLDLAGWPVLAAGEPLAVLDRLAAEMEHRRDRQADEVLRSLGHLPPADAQSPEAARRRVPPGAGLL